MPVCIPPNKLKLPVGSECFAVGVNEFEDSNSTNELIEIKMPIRKMEDCQQISNFAHDDHHICAGNEEQVSSGKKIEKIKKDIFQSTVEISCFYDCE